MRLSAPGVAERQHVLATVRAGRYLAGDWGDDLVYARVNLYQDQAVVGQGLCYRGSRSYWGPAFYQTIHPTRAGQTWWVGPFGAWHN